MVGGCHKMEARHAYSYRLGKSSTSPVFNIHRLTKQCTNERGVSFSVFAVKRCITVCIGSDYGRACGRIEWKER